MKKQTRMLVIFVGAAVLLLGIGQYVLRNQINLKLPNISVRDVFKPDEANISPTEVISSETLSIDFGNGQKVTGQAITQNAYQSLVKVAKDNNMKVEVKQYKYGVMVTKVGDVANSPNSAWMYAVNGKPGQIAADRYIVHPGDKVEWKFTKF
ncbi:DUF4430 domain-containing protein [Candidatus Gottesmanbacteria bacterium]|nr:DUF4430 domain-containing protein [Candidatus Gottesmanbacteria bacterium]